MGRSFWALAFVFASAGAVMADVLKLRFADALPIEHTVTTDKAYPEYEFFLTSGDRKPLAVKFDPKTPVVFKGTNPGPDHVFVAVPAGARKKYATEKEFEAALKSSEVEGMVRANETLFSWILVPVGDPRQRIVREHKLSKIDAKDGIVLITKDIDPKGEKSDKAPGRSGFYDPHRMWVAGLAAFVGVTLGGLWLAGRVRRKV